MKPRTVLRVLPGTEYMAPGMYKLEIGNYLADKTTSIQIYSEDGEPYMTATVCVQGSNVGDGNVLIKDWSENQGILRCLIDAGVIGEPVRHVPTGFVTAAVCPLLI